MRNKAHKQRHTSKRGVARKEAAGGRATEKRKVFQPNHKVLTKKGGNEQGSKDKQKQIASAHRKLNQEAVAKDKLIGSRSGPPRIVAFIPVNESASSHITRAALFDSCQCEAPKTEAPTHVASDRHRFTALLSPDLNEQRILDMVKVADVVVMSIDCSAAVQDTIKELQTETGVADDIGGMSQYSGSTWFADIGLCITDATRELIHAVNSQGCPTTIVILQGLESYSDDRRRRHTIRIHERYFHSILSDETRVMVADSEAEKSEFLRCLSNVKLRHIQWREIRPYFVADARSYNAETRELELRGFLRGAAASASMLFHVTNHNTFRATHISAPGDPIASRGDEAVGLLDEADEDYQESLTGIQENETAHDENEFPTEADVAHAHQQRHTVWVPEGVSEYQAHWYDDGEDHPNPRPAVAPVHEDAHALVETGSRHTAQSDIALLRAADVLRHEQLTDEERMAERQQLLEDCEDEERHADEVDTPVDMPARQRFGKYRPMKSFSTTAWDPKENLPIEYSRIFELSGYSRIRDDALAETTQCPVAVGTYVSVVLSNVPPGVVEAEMLICSGQLRHEQKWSVVHCHVQRSTEYQEPIKSKTTMLCHIGFRKFFCEPIFSDPVVGNRTKFARYFLPGEKFRIATFYAPIAYHPCPVMMYEAPTVNEIGQQSALRLALYGSVLPPNPDFLILKRIVLTGRIAVIYKKQLVVKYMFFNEDDVKWFQPVDLYTRLGRQGRIIKAVGTHGLFKASFNDTVFQHDMICMAIYKRVFPKWRTVVYDESAEDGEDEEASDSDAD